MYDRLVKGLMERGEVDSLQVASTVSIEYESIITVLLLIFLTGRFVSLYAAAFVFVLAVLLLKGRILTFGVIRENDDRFQTLLYYMLLTLSSTIILVGWSLWN